MGYPCPKFGYVLFGGPCFDQVTNAQLRRSSRQDEDVQSSSDGHEAEEQPVVAWAA